MTDEESNRFPKSSRFANNSDLPDLRFYNHVKDNKQILVNNQLNNINYNPFNSPQQKTKANFPIDFFHLQNKITLSDIPLTDSIPIFQLNDAQFQDPIKFIDSVHEMGAKYGAIKLVIPENTENSFKSNFQINSDLFWFQTNKLLNNSTNNELENRLRFHQELIEFHLQHKKEDPLTEVTLANEENSKESPIPPTSDALKASTPDSNPNTKDSTPVPVNEPKKPKSNLPSFLNKLPMIDKRPLDLYKLFRSVLIRGGFIEVVNKKLWAQIGRELGYKGKIMTSLSSSLKSSYLRILYPFEMALNNRKYELVGIVAPTADSTNGADDENTNDSHHPMSDSPGIDVEPPLIIGSSKDFKRSIKLKSAKGFLLNSPHLIDVKQPNTFTSKGMNEGEIDTTKKRKKNSGESAITPITPASQINHGLKSIINNQSVYQDDSRLDLNGKSASIYNLRQFMEKDLKFQEYIIQQNKDHFNKVNVNSNDKFFYQFNDQNISVMERNIINLEKFEQLYWSFIMNKKSKQSDNDVNTNDIDTWNDGLELENGTNLPSFINGSGFARIGDDLINHKNHLNNVNVNNVTSTNNANGANTANNYTTSKNSSPTNNVETNTYNSSDYINNLIQTSLNPWNLHNLPVLANSLLGGLSESDLNNQDLINPTLSIGMTFSTENWKCEDHFTQLCNYQFFGSYKKWYFIPESDFEKFEELVKEVNDKNKERVNINNDGWNVEALLKYFNNGEDTTNIEYESLLNSLENMINPSPDYNNSRMQHSNELFQKIIDYRNQRREKLNYNQEFMITPELLKKRGINFTTTIQKPGEFIIKFPKTYSSTVSFGLNLSEEVNFATKNWLNYAIEGEKWLNKQSILPNFSIFKLLINLAQLYESGNNNVFFNSEIYEQSLQMYSLLYKQELKLRDRVRKKFSHIRELVIDDKTFGDIDSTADDDLASTFPSKVVLTDVKLKQTFILSLPRFLEYVELSELENDYDIKSVPKLIGNPNLKIELHLFYSDDKLKSFYRILNTYSIDYDEWMQNYERLMNENSELSLRVYRSLLIDGEKIYLALSSSNFFHVFNNKPNNEPEDYETIKLNTFKNYIENLRLFVNDANDFIEECQSILSIKHQQRIRNGNTNNDFQRPNGDVLARLINLIDKIPTLNFSCSETEQILEFKVEIENFDRACRLLISKAKQSNSLQEFNDLINLGQSFGIELPSLTFLIRLRDRLQWIDTHDKILKGGDPYSDKKDIFSLQDLKNFRDLGINLLGRRDIDKVRIIDSIIDHSEEMNYKLVEFLSFEYTESVSFEELDRILTDLESKSKAQGENRIFVYLDNYEKLVNLKQNSKIVKQFKDFKASLATGGKFTIQEIKQLQTSINESGLKFDMRVLDNNLSNGEDWVSNVWKKFKDLKIITVLNKGTNPTEDMNPKLNINDYLMEKLQQISNKNDFSLSLKSDSYSSSSSHIYYKEDNESLEDPTQQQIYCACREFEFGTMIECDKCKEWYHTQCVNESALESDNNNDDNYSCPICKLIDSGIFTDHFLTKQLTYRQLLALVAEGKQLNVFPMNELAKLEQLSDFVTVSFKDLNIEIDKVKQSDERLANKVDHLRFFLRKVYGAGILIEELITDLLSTIRKFEYDLSILMPLVTPIDRELNKQDSGNEAIESAKSEEQTGLKPTHEYTDNRSFASNISLDDSVPNVKSQTTTYASVLNLHPNTFDQTNENPTPKRTPIDNLKNAPVEHINDSSLSGVENNTNDATASLNSNYSNTQNTNRISDSVPNQNINLESEDQSSSNERQHEYSLPVDAEPEELIPFLASQVELKRDDASTATPVKATTENNINSTTSDGITNESADSNINNQV
ncbi:DEHA2D02310p [Debaryomyces hansenii CBS767]|uniref:DEHA2D02310p n=1 Tax=Debaryomyces hansenii (strain ATCC 36239 / CBS 767 / BCRC 21394 / JCM 1990 / NBRC 0083 / IGC 2968) TaxID=284592 RepID=Q6BTA2_DEBHA|nr:DEHA2D02310p [Debaryomyces hansenii CBS767]CAG86700.2 DEHA2D02310p [Debaryomyces hansenii CBS767]|eukprot:XP_458568.2 DEHA2D02310p [Debaryomyces hansenii CBS767]